MSWRASRHGPTSKLDRSPSIARKVVEGLARADTPHVALDPTVAEQVTATIEPRIGMESPGTSDDSRLIDNTATLANARFCSIFNKLLNYCLDRSLRLT